MNPLPESGRMHDPSAPPSDDPDGLDALEAALSADPACIDAARKRVTAIRTTPVPTAMVARDVHFPDVPAVTPPATTAPTTPPPKPGRGGGLLAELKQAVAEQKRVEADSSREEERVREVIGTALRRVFEYLHDLVGQLNQLRPPIPRSYTLLVTGTVFDGLSWQEGFTGHRSQPHTNGDLLERVTLSYRLGGAGDTLIERTGSGIERLRQALFDFGFKTECTERRNARREVEFATFAVRSEISVQVQWRADFPRRQVIVEMRNLERLGTVEFALPAFALNPEFLDEFGRMMLGQPNRFRELLPR